MGIKLPEKSILDELAEKKDRIIEEGNLYLAYIYSSLSRQPKRVYRFEDLIEIAKTLRIAKGTRELRLKAQTQNGEIDVIRTTKFSLEPLFKRVVNLFKAYQSVRDLSPESS
ncbi:hypothetical protein JCM9492_13350 [Aquifex pyrophilus]